MLSASIPSLHAKIHMAAFLSLSYGNPCLLVPQILIVGSAASGAMSRSDPATGQASDALLDDILGDLGEPARASRYAVPEDFALPIQRKKHKEHSLWAAHQGTTRPESITSAELSDSSSMMSNGSAACAHKPAVPHIAESAGLLKQESETTALSLI